MQLNNSKTQIWSQMAYQLAHTVYKKFWKELIHAYFPYTSPLFEVLEPNLINIT
jgi:hypothetical protein